MSRSLNDLHPLMRDVAKRVIDICAMKDVILLVTCTLRTEEEQARLYAQGRTAPGRIVTYAKPGQSAHNYGLAMDVVPLIDGKPMWRADHPAWKVYGETAAKAGLEWAGHWRKFREFPHVEWPDWRGVVKAGIKTV